MLLVYGTMGLTWGLSVNLLGAGLLAVLAGLCLLHFDARGLKVYAPIPPPIVCATSIIAVQVVVHSEPLDTIRPFVPWMLHLVVIQSLCVREGFTHRFAFVFFILGLATLPYMSFANDVYNRARLDSSITIANSNDLAAWFGFCAVYATVFAIESKVVISRLVSSLLAIASLYVIGLTVSRGALLAVTLATAVALRRLSRRGLTSFLILILLCAAIYESGLFDQSILTYTNQAQKKPVDFSSGHSPCGASWVHH